MTMHSEGFNLYSGVFDNMVCQIPTIAPPVPEGGDGGIHALFT